VKKLYRCSCHCLGSTKAFIAIPSRVIQRKAATDDDDDDDDDIIIKNNNSRHILELLTVTVGMDGSIDAAGKYMVDFLDNYRGGGDTQYEAAAAAAAAAAVVVVVVVVAADLDLNGVGLVSHPVPDARGRFECVDSTLF
jgi:hypothetical protein